jgi:AcrR family transcriptional regulator
MARQTRSPEVIKKIKNDIIEEAMKLILKTGFNNMSMRKLADRVGMSATNIYYYYSSKDEIYLNIQIKGFQALQTMLEKIDMPENDPVENLRKMIHAYLEFGFKNPDYYQIMLNSDTPRYLEYKNKNKKMEPIAFKAKQMAINSIAVPLRVLEQISAVNDNVPPEDLFFRAYQLWITLHGIVTLNNKKILLELDEIIPEALIDRMREELIHPFLNHEHAANGESSNEN